MIELGEDETAEDVAPFQKRVRQAANMVRSDVVTLDECQAHEVDVKTDEEFREAVQEHIQSRYVHSVDDEGGEEKGTTDVDWEALYQEFDLDTPDSVGDPYASSVQLNLAIEVSEQNIAGSPESHIEQAVDAGKLDRMTERDPDGGDVLAGYRLGRVA